MGPVIKSRDDTEFDLENYALTRAYSTISPFFS